MFHYRNVADGYRMVGNAVPVRMAEALARKIAEDLGEGE
ncbi:MAG: DNA cytosine methyltransferase [Candidatus Methanosuratincola sp.]